MGPILSKNFYILITVIILLIFNMIKTVELVSSNNSLQGSYNISKYLKLNDSSKDRKILKYIESIQGNNLGLKSNGFEFNFINLMLIFMALYFSMFSISKIKALQKELEDKKQEIERQMKEQQDSIFDLKKQI